LIESDVVIYNAYGKEVGFKEIREGSIILDLSEFEKGLYTLKFVSEGKTLIRKIIIQ
jgi:hypothetical protein